MLKFINTRYPITEYVGFGESSKRHIHIHDTHIHTYTHTNTHTHTRVSDLCHTGFVRHIDVAMATIYITTPTPEDQLERVNLLLAGKNALPSFFYTMVRETG